jgi:hypothetical protein
LRYGDLDAVGRLRLDALCRALAREQLYDAAYVVDPVGCAERAVSLANTTHRMLVAFEKHLAGRKTSKLESYLASKGDGRA